jgi:hypothetical protein
MDDGATKVAGLAPAKSPLNITITAEHHILLCAAN